MAAVSLCLKCLVLEGGAGIFVIDADNDKPGYRTPFHVGGVVAGATSPVTHAEWEGKGVPSEVGVDEAKALAAKAIAGPKK